MNREKMTQMAFLVISAIILGWMIQNNYEMLMIATGGNQMVSIFGTCLFDVGAIVWMFVYIYTAKGANQRGIALTTSALDLLMSVISVGIHIASTADKSWLSWVATIILIVTAVNAIMLWAFHINAPEHIEAAKAKQMQDDTMQLAYKIAEQQRAKTAAEIAGRISASMVANANKVLLESFGLSVDDEQPKHKALPAPTLSPAPTASLASDVPSVPSVGDVPKNS